MISKDMIISDIIQTYPQTLPVFQRYRLECRECQIADIETLEHGADVHKVDVTELVDALNKVISNR